MILIVFFFFGIVFSESSFQKRHLKLIDIVNSNPKATWTAGLNDLVVKYTEEEIMEMLLPSLFTRKDLEYFENNPPKIYQNENIPPGSYNTYKKFPKCKQPVLDQGKCGSCWAVSAATVLEDRFCVEKDEKTRLSPQDFVSCDKGDAGCRGGGMMSLWTYAAMNGLVTEDCFPYHASDNVTCPEKCENSTEDWKSVKHYAKNGGTVQFYSLKSAMNFMAEGGSIQGGFAVYEDFLNYKSGVYHHTTGKKLGYHAIKIIGYDYSSWIVQNSWGDKWGMKGFFSIVKGQNECELENNLWGAKAEKVGD